jgi:CheY-like chemotaxis protein
MHKLACTLLVDDDQTTNYLNRKLLERLAISDTVLVAENGQQALNLLTDYCQEATPSCPALLFLDVKMPVMNGFEFLEAYHKLPWAQERNIVIVVLTTSLHPQDVQRVAELPVAGFLSKPLTQEKVNQILQKHFAQNFPT